MRFLRTIRLDQSDSRVFEAAANPGEWAVPGSFAFLDVDRATLSGKQLQAFRQGFLGVETTGWSTLVEIAEISDGEYRRVIEILATMFVNRYGAPDIDTALPAAREEAQYASSLCEHDLHTLLALEREFGDGGIIENLKVIEPNAADHRKVKLFGPAAE